MSRTVLDFEECVNLCKEYKEEFGNLDIPTSYVTKDGVKLGNWVSNQRRRAESCTPEHKKMLDDIGFVWFTKKSWEYFYNIAKDYCEEFGSINHIPCNKNYKGVDLGRWLTKNRSKYRDNKLSKERIKLLEEIGFDWKNKAKHRYDLHLSLFKDYYKENGHLLPSVNEVYKGVEIGIYVARLRQYYKGNKLRKEDIKELEALGMKWSGRRGFWDYCYELCIKYISLDKKIVFTTIFNREKIGLWLSRQENLKEYGSLTEEQIKLVEELKVFNSIENSEEKWNMGFLKAKSFYEENKNLLPDNSSYVSLWVKIWLEAQRELKSKKLLKEDYIKALDELGMVWNM